MTRPTIDHTYLENKLRIGELNVFDCQYHKLLLDVLHGTDKEDRTGVGTRSVFGAQAKYDLSSGEFPLLTTKKVPWKLVAHELLWFISGDTNIKYLLDNNVHIWDEWTPAYKDTGKLGVEEAHYYAQTNKLDDYEPLNLGPVYGKQWRSWEPHIGQHGKSSIDQLASVINKIETNPTDRRLIVTAWNPNEVGDMALPPCHCLFQFNVRDDTLDLQLYQRSADIFLGVPFNIASYSMLLAMVAQVTSLNPGVFTHTFGDLHIYHNHFEQVHEQLENDSFDPPKLKLAQDIHNIDDFTIDDINIVDYESHGTIKAPIAI
jgi:thymidylate synthase